MDEVTIITDNRVGALAAIAEALGGAGVNIEAISAYEQGGNAVFRVLTGDPNSAKKLVEKVPGVSGVSLSEVVVVKLPNRPGELGKLTRKLANRGVDLQSLYIVSRSNEHTEVAVKPAGAQVEKTKEALGIRR